MSQSGMEIKIYIFSGLYFILPGAWIKLHLSITPQDNLDFYSQNFLCRSNNTMQISIYLKICNFFSH